MDFGPDVVVLSHVHPLKNVINDKEVIQLKQGIIITVCMYSVQDEIDSNY